MEEKQTDSKKVFQCLECPKKYMYKGGLAKHM